MSTTCKIVNKYTFWRTIKNADCVSLTEDALEFKDRNKDRNTDRQADRKIER